MKTIVLYDIGNGGHREAFMQFFAKSVLELGHEVICIMPETSAIQSWVQQNVVSQNIHYYDMLIESKNYTSLGRFNNSFSKINVWRKQKIAFQQIEIELQKKIDLVFFNWLDSQMSNYLPAQIIDFIFPYQWTGVYFHPVIFRQRPDFLEHKTSFSDVDNLFLAKKCIAITVHDEGLKDKLQYRTGKQTLLFPEIADATPPNPSFPLAQKIKTKANGRIVIGIIGLEPYKGVFTLMNVVKIADATQFFFVFTGMYNENSLIYLSENQKAEYLEFIKNPPENCIWQTGSFKEGEEYNSVICSFDIIHLVYKKFYSSSNRLTKAAIFKKLVIGNNLGCVGEDIPKYNLGETVDEDDVEAQYQKLKILRDRILRNDFPMEQWEIYAKKHSAESLKDKFKTLISLLP